MVSSTSQVFRRDDKAQLPDDRNILFICLGWDYDKEIDLDASIVGLTAEKEEECKVFYQNVKVRGLQHMGDKRKNEKTDNSGIAD